MDGFNIVSDQDIVNEICVFDWKGLLRQDLLKVAKVYYYFSVQFRENLETARKLYPADPKLKELEEGECATSNLSPWPGVARENESMDHDEFMKRALALSPRANFQGCELEIAGQRYLQACRNMSAKARAQSIASYENGGLESVFRAILEARDWDDPTLGAFKHFLEKHIEFDSDAENGHGALSRQLQPDDQLVAPLWLAFRDMLLEAAPSLAKVASRGCT